MLIFAANKVIFGGARAGWLADASQNWRGGQNVRIQKLKGDIK